MILAIDPGVTSGWAVFTGDGTVLDMGQGRLKYLHQYLKGFEAKFGAEPDTVIIETYTILPTPRSLKANIGPNRLQTVEAIGVVRAFCLDWNCRVIMQDPAFKTIGYKWLPSNVKPPSNHADSHQFDALAHGQYYLVRNNIVTVKIND